MLSSPGCLDVGVEAATPTPTGAAGAEAAGPDGQLLVPQASPWMRFSSQ